MTRSWHAHHWGLHYFMLAEIRSCRLSVLAVMEVEQSRENIVSGHHSARNDARFLIQQVPTILPASVMRPSRVPSCLIAGNSPQTARTRAAKRQGLALRKGSRSPGWRHTDMSCP